MTTPDTGSYGWSRCPSCGRRLDHVAAGRPACPSCNPAGLVGPAVDPLVPAEFIEFTVSSDEDGSVVESLVLDTEPTP